MKRVVLPNGLPVIYEHKKGNSIVVEVMVKVGSNHEKKDERGISHFLEHILFEGTKKRPTNKEISNEIEKIGGDFNAYTSNERTCFYIKVLKKHFKRAMDVLADILQNPLFEEKNIEKEKNVVIKEIDMVNDEPKFFQWVMLQKNLFEKHPGKYPTYGEKKVISGLNREKVRAYFGKYYVPKNMVLSITGEAKNWEEEAKKNFLVKGGKEAKYPEIREPSQKKNKIKTAKKNVINTYLVMGFKTVPREHRDSYVIDVINGILGRGQSGRIFTEVRGKRGLAYDVGTESIAEKSFGYFAVYASINKKNLSQVKSLILTEIEKLKNISVTDLKEAKDYLEGDYLLDLEDSQKVADQMLFWELAKDAKLMKNYLPQIKKVSIKDVKRVAEKYLKYHTLVIIEGKS